MKNKLTIKVEKWYHIVLMIFFITNSIFAQCPSAPSTCTYSVTANSTTSYTVAANEKLCISSGTYTGNINSVASTGVIYVASGAVFNPSSFNNFGGTLIICGTSTLPGFNFDNTAGTARLENYGSLTLTGSYGFNQASTWINGVGAKLTINNNITMNSVSFTNNGNVLMKGSFTMNTGTNTFINHDSLVALGNINLNASITNDGYLFAKGSDMTLNASGNIVNSCFFVADGAFTYNGNDTLFVTGFTWATGLNSSSFVLQGKAVNVYSGGFIQGLNFSNNGTPVIGNGSFVFSGNTINQGPFGNDGLGLNFYDSGIPSGGKYFDTQNTLPHGSVTKNATATRDGTFIPGTCSNLIKCNINSAGNDTIICGSSINLRDAVSSSPYYEAWRVVAGNPAAATIDPVTGLVSGMNVSGDYQFELYKLSNNNCKDVIKITVNAPPSSNLTVSGNNVCRNGNTNTTVVVNNAENTVTYEAYLGATLLGSGLGQNTNLNISIPLSLLADGDNVITFKAKRAGCSTVDLVNSATVTVYPNQLPSATVAATSPVCSGGTSTVTIAATKGITYTIRDQSNNVVGTQTANASGNIQITTSVLTASTEPTDYTFTITATVSNCTSVILNTKPVVTVNPAQNPAATVSATSPICSGGTSTVTISATKGITYTVRDQSNNLLGSQTASATGNINIVTSALTATGGPAQFTFTITATISGCNDVVLNTKPVVTVNPSQNPAASVSASSPICSGNTSTVTIAATNGVTYTVRDQSNNILGTQTATSTGNLSFATTALTATTGPVSYTLTVTATINGCNSVVLNTKPVVVVNPIQNPSAAVSATSPICSGGTSVVTIAATNGITYTIRDQNNNIIGTKVATATGNMDITTSALTATTDPTSYIFTITASISSCSNVELTSKPVVVVNPIQNPAATVTVTSPICSGSTSIVSISATKGMTYTVRDQNNNILGTKLAIASGNLDITTTTLTATTAPTLYNLTVTATVGGCNAVVLTTNPQILVNPSQSASATVTATSPICSGSTSTVTIFATQGITYAIRDQNNNVLASQKANASGNIQIVTSALTAPTSSVNYLLTITATVPGCSDVVLTTKPTVVVNPNLTPTVTISAPTNTICAGSSITFTATPTNEGSAPQYQWKLNGVNVNGQTSSTYTTSTLVNGDKVTVSMISNASCLAVNSALSNEIVMNIGTNLVPSVSINTPATTICAGTNATFTATVGNGGANPVFQWKINGNNAGTSTTSNTFSRTNFVNGDTISVVLTSNETCVITNTANSNKIGLIVNPVQNPSASVTATSPLCSGQTSTVTINATNGITYTVRDQNNNIVGTKKATSNGPMTIVTSQLTATGAVQNYTFTVTASVAGCSDVVLTSKPNVVVGPIQNPNVSVTATSPICSGGTASLVTVLGTSGINYTVKDQNNNILGTGSASTSGTLNITTTPLTATNAPQNYTFTLIASTSGCSDVELTSKPIVVVNPVQNPAASVTAVTPICSGNTSTITIAAVEGITYTVRDQNNVVLGTQKASATGNINITTTALSAVSGPTNYTITVTASVGGCSDVILTNKPVIVVNPIQDPLASVTATSPLCSGQSSTVVIAATNGITYTIRDQNNTVLGTQTATQNGNISINTTPLTALTEPTDYILTVTASVNGCSNVTLSTKPLVKVNPVQSPTAIVSATSPICSGNVSVVTINGTKGITYTIRDQNNTLLGTKLATDNALLTISTSPLIATSNPTNYTLTITATVNGCNDVVLNTKPVVVVNPVQDPNILVAATSPICSGGTSVISFTATNGITYTVRDQNNTVVGTKSANSNGPFTITTSSLVAIASAPTTYTFTITATVGGCSDVILNTKPSVVVNPVQILNASVTATSPLCSGNTSTVTIAATAGMTYTIRDQNNTVLGTKFSSKTENIDIITTPLVATTAPTNYTFTITASVSGCNDVILNTKPVVLVNPVQNPAASVTATSPICSGGTSVVTIDATAGMTYTIRDQNNVVVGTRTVSTNGIVSITTSALVATNEPLTYTFTITASVGGCNNVVLNTRPLVVVNPVQNPNALVTASSPLCGNQSSRIKIVSTKGLTYSVYDGSDLVTSIASGVASNSDSLILNTTPLTVGTHTFTIISSVAGCSNVTLTTKPVVIVNKLPAMITVSGQTICSNTSSARITLTGVESGVSYQAYRESVAVGNPIIGPANQIELNNATPLTLGDNIISIKSSIAGCTVVDNSDTALIKINLMPTQRSFTATSPICEGTLATVNLQNPETGVIYTVYDKLNTKDTTLSPLNSAGVGNYALRGVGLHTLSIKASIPGCSVFDFSNTVNVQVNVGVQPVVLSGVPNAPICQSVDTAKITINNPEPLVDYNFYSQVGSVETLLNSTPITSTNPSFTIRNIPVGTNEYLIRATIGGCGTAIVKEFKITVDSIINVTKPKLNAGFKDVCLGSSSLVSVSISGTQAGVTYQLKDNGVNLGNSIISNSANLDLSFGTFNLAVGQHNFSVVGSNLGCGASALITKDTVIVSDSLNTTNPKIDAGVENVCQGSSNTIIVNITNTQKDVTYQLYNGVSPVGPPQKALYNNDTLIFGPMTLAVGSHVFGASIVNAGCSEVKIKSTDLVVVSDSLQRNSPTLEAGATDVCETSSTVTVNLLNAQNNVSYTLVDNDTVRLATVLSTSSTVNFGAFTLPLGAHKFTVKAKNIGCDTVLLKTSDSVNVNKSINVDGPKLLADTNVICSDGTAKLKLTKTQEGVTYSLYQDGILKESKVANTVNEELEYGPYTLSVGTHLFTLNAHNNACSDSLKTSQSIKVNDKPNADNFEVITNAPVLCNNADLFVTVATSRDSNYSYQVVDLHSNVYNNLGVSKLGNSDTLYFGPFTNLGVGTHKIKVIESVQNCLSDTSAGVDLLINNSLDVDKPKLKANKNVICEDGSVSVSITNTSIGDVYRIKLDGVAILDSIVSRFDGDTLNFGPLFNLDTGNHVFSATTKNAGCGIFDLTSKDTIRVNPIPSKLTSIDNNSPICINNSATIIVEPVKDVFYKLYKKIDTSFVSGPSSSVLTTSVYTQSGVDSLLVMASIAGCSDVYLDSVQYITINQYPTENLSASDVSICSGDSAKVTLTGTTSSFEYFAKLSNGTIVKRKGPGNLVFAFGSNDIKSVVDIVTYGIYVPGCGSNDVLNSKIFKFKDTLITQMDVVCEDSSNVYRIDTIPGAINYNWVLPNGSTLVYQNKNIAKIRWSDTSSSGTIKVYPVSSSGGACSNFENDITVIVYASLKGNASYYQKDILCVGDVDTIGVENLLGVRTDSLLVDNGVLIIGKITTGAYPKYIVQYNAANTYIHKYKVTSYCGEDSIYVADTVKVLAYPVVNAGNYPVFDMKYFPREIILDGSNSSSGNFIYKWTALPDNNINNYTNIIASMVPQQTVTTISLTISNANGMCAASDTARIVVDLGIFIPNVFTPNGDGDHDTWVLENVRSFYPNVQVDIYSKWGTLIYHNDGYSTPWDGTRNGEDVPAATYYYVIDLKKPGFKPLAGSVTIIR